MAIKIESPVDFGLAARAQSVIRGALGLKSPDEMLVSWFLIGAFVIITSSIGLIGTILLLPLVLLGLFIAVLRFVPPIERRWPVGG